MRKINFLWLFIAVTLIVTHIGIAQERKPANERPRGDNQGRDYQEREQSSDEAQARAERAMKDVLRVMRDADKLTDEQVEEILNMVFPKDIDWDVRYEAYLKENPGVAKAVKSGRISKEQVIAGMKSREGEKELTEEERLEALYQRMLKEDSSLGRTPKAELMPKLKEMLERGEGQDIHREDIEEPRFMTFGRYLNNLIYGTRQFAPDDEDLRKLHDIGVAEIQRQKRQEQEDRAEERERVGRQRLNGFVMQRLDSLLEHVGESIGQRYELDETTVNSLRRDVRESVRAQLDQGKGDKLGGAARVGGMDLLEMLLSQPEYKAAFAKHLNEEQLQDYLDFTRARRQREQKAINRQLIAVLDQQLSLTTDQRQQIEQILGTEKITDELLNSVVMIEKFDLQDSVNVLHKQNIPIEKILSKSQSSIWQLLVAPSDEPDPRLIQYREAEAEINKAVEAGQITREQASERLGELRRRLWATDNRKPETENRLRLIAEAKLAAHTEQLGPLDERASKRLALAAKGVVEQYLESQDTGQRKDPTEMDDDEFEKAAGEIRRMVAAGRITREQASQRLERMKLRTRGKDEGEPRISTDITNHPLYQQTIKDVLSDEAFAQYKARQAERQAFRLQAGRDLAIAGLDTLLLLDENQRKHFEAAVAKLSTPSANDRIPIPVLIFIQLFDPTVDGRNIVIHPDSDILSEWQRERLGEYANNFGEWVAIDNTVRQRR